MKILVVDDEHSFGKLLGHTLKRLGHKPVVATHPEDALQLLTDDVDAVITDIDMPVMNGVELAKAIRELRDEMPIAFCTGSAPEGRAIREAGEIGAVLPKVWTVKDVKRVVEGLRPPPKPRSDRAPSSPIAHIYEESVAEPPPTPPRTRKRRKVRIAFRSWSQVLRLCSDSVRGRVQVTVPGPDNLDPGADVTISLVLPEEITVKIAGCVAAVRPRANENPEIVIELSGLTDELRNRLEMLAIASQPTVDPRTRTPKGTPPEPALARGSRDMRVSQILGPTGKLRQQIEGLPARMSRPKTGEDEEE